MTRTKGFGPGDVFREICWRPEGKWQRVTGPDATQEGAKEFLPNAVNTVDLVGLEGATRAEACVEMLLCHGGTADKCLRVNGRPWIPIAESRLIPGEAGRGGPEGEYQYMRYPCTEIPLHQLIEGSNTFELTCSSGTSLGAAWPQWILYGVTFRIYYDPSVPHPRARVVTPASGAVLGHNPELTVQMEGGQDAHRVDFIGLYEDFDWQGDGQYRQWQYRHLFCEIHNHMGTAAQPPYTEPWDNAWIPTQNQPMQVMARVTDSAGMSSVTSAVEGVRLSRPRTVRMYRPFDVPPLWSTRMGNRHQCSVDLQDDLSHAIDAKVIMVTWNGVAADEIGINDQKVIERVGANHDLSHDEFAVPVDLLKSGVNTLYTFSNTEHHGIEVQWPGMVLLVRYDMTEELPGD